MYSDIIIHIDSSVTSMAVRPAAGKHAKRKLTNEQIVLCAILISVCMPGGAVSRRDQYKWLLSHLKVWSGADNSALLQAVSDITPTTLERYMTLAGMAKVIRTNGKHSAFSDFARRNDVDLAHNFMSYAEAITHNSWIVPQVKPVTSVENFCKTVQDKDTVRITVGAGGTASNAIIKEQTEAIDKLFEAPVPSYQISRPPQCLSRPEIVFNNTPTSDTSSQEISLPTPVHVTSVKRKWWQKLLGT